MIPKFELQAVINKYYLNGMNEAVKWDIKDKNLNIKFTSPTKEMIGEVTHTDFTLPDANIGISNTSQLLKLISIANGDVLLSFVRNGKSFSKLIISDNQFTANYTLADMLTINKSGAYKGSEDYNLTTSLDKDIILAMIKAKSALDESPTVMLKPSTNMDGEFELELVFGGDIEYSNKVSYYLANFVKNNVSHDFTLGFNSDLLKEILVVNKDSDEAKLSINLEGLMKLEFKSGNIKSIYYIVQKDI
jgi:hypothetical protein